MRTRSVRRNQPPLRSKPIGKPTGVVHNGPPGRAMEGLLLPTLALLNASGFTETQATALFRRAWKGAAQVRGSKTVKPIDPHNSYAEIVSRWSRDRRFLDGGGTPRLLTYKGRNGIEGLVRLVDNTTDPRSALKVLMRFGTVKHVGNGRYRLLWPFFSVASSSDFAFEPSANFLAEASATVLGMLKRRRQPLGTGPFWRVADSTSVPERYVNDFLTFLRKRSLPFLEEIDEWLHAHAVTPSRAEGSLKLGLGLFSIVSRESVSLRLRGDASAASAG